ncbi:hypothetical protein N658DRAFT_53506 [Parathielavia hyrcaniae]|uniref:Uncharacterized protein n=1 Tax=Parathielavia hyrcaniae TaxID=113614 RepID=A0AAN6Q1H6_9PEZI|nr:hypothetical protein N658DRAFT_53506 [Parathielavia hyrcaniae]
MGHFLALVRIRTAPLDPQGTLAKLVGSLSLSRLRTSLIDTGFEDVCRVPTVLRSGPEPHGRGRAVRVAADSLEGVCLKRSMSFALHRVTLYIFCSRRALYVRIPPDNPSMLKVSDSLSSTCRTSIILERGPVPSILLTANSASVLGLTLSGVFIS